MTRRKFIYFLCGASVTPLFTGCFSSKKNPTPSTQKELYQQELKKLKEEYFNLEKEEQTLTAYQKKYAYQISVITSVQRAFKTSLDKMVELNFETPIEEKYPIDITFTFPFWFGPNPAISKDEYFVRKYAGDDLLFMNFGIECRLDNMYRFRNDLFGNSDPDRFVKEHFGQNNLLDFYVNIFYKVTAYKDIDVFIWLKTLENQGLLQINELLNLDKIKIVNFEFIKYFYNVYLKYEKDLDPKDFYKKILPNIPLKSWTFTVNGNKVNFTREDYIPYVFSLMIMERLILEAKKESAKTKNKSLWFKNIFNIFGAIH